MIKEIRERLEVANAHPFLFVGSGFTRRYLSSDDWAALIEHFARQAMPGNEFAYEIYKNKAIAQGMMGHAMIPEITQLIETDFNQLFLTAPQFADMREKNKGLIKSGVSPLKIAVADWIGKQSDSFDVPHHADEISAIGHARRNIAGIITTNFDQYLEHIFPDYIPYIGQNELLFNESYGIGEIYKIHGSISDPSSLVLTTHDYEEYHKRNAYLSAKLLTIFLEHPIIFIGYSLNDENVRTIFASIADCLSEEQLKTLSNRIFFLQREKEGRQNGFSIVRDSFGNKGLEFQRLVVEDFSLVYKAISGLRTSYTPKVLRKLKEDIYELVASSVPKERIRVVGIDDATDLDQIEFVIGVGAIKQLEEQGYHGLELKDLIEDLILEDKKLDPQSVVDLVLPKLGKQSSYNLPVFKYLQRATLKNLDNSFLEYIHEVQDKGIHQWTNTSMRKAHHCKTIFGSIKALEASYDHAKFKETYLALDCVPFMKPESIDADELKKWLAEIYKQHDPLRQKESTMLSTNFRRTVKIFDYLKYGYKKAPLVPKD